MSGADRELSGNIWKVDDGKTAAQGLRVWSGLPDFTVDFQETSLTSIDHAAPGRRWDTLKSGKRAHDAS